MKKLRELVSDTLIYGISSVVARFINYLLVPFYTDVFKPSAYGIIGLIYSAIAFLNVLFTFGMESAYLRYAAERRRARNVFKTLQLSLLGIGSLLAFLLWLVKPWVLPLMSLDAGTQSLYLMMIGILWFDTMGIVPFAELRLVRKSMLFALLRLGNVLLNLGLNFYLVLGLHWGLEAVLVSNLAASSLTTVVLWGVTWRMMKGSWEIPLLQRALKFGLPFVPTGIAYAVNEFLDRFFLNGMSQHSVTQIYGAGFTPESITGIYNACYKLAVFMLLLIQMFRMAWQPFFLRHAEDEQAGQLFSDVFSYFNLVAGVLFLGVSLFVAQIVQIRIPVLDAYIIGKEYWMGLSVVPVLLGAYWFQGWYVNFTAGIFIKEKTKRLPQITLIGAAVTVAGNILLVPRYGMMGSAWATLSSYAVMSGMIYYYSVRAFEVPYRLGRGLSVMGIAVVALLLQPYAESWIQTAWAADLFIFMGGVILMALLGFPTSQLFIRNRS